MKKMVKISIKTRTVSFTIIVNGLEENSEIKMSLVSMYR